MAWFVRIAVVVCAVAGCDGGGAAPGPEPEADALPACASPLARAIYEAMVPVVGESTVPLAELAHPGVIEPIVHVSAHEVSSRLAELIAGAEREVSLQAPGDLEPLLDALAALETRRRDAGATTPVIVRVVVDAEETRPLLVAALEARAFDPALVSVEVAVDQLGTLRVEAAVVDGHTFLATAGETGWVFGGDVARAALADFDYTWRHSTATDEPAHAILPLAGMEGADSVCVVLALTRQGAVLPGRDVENPQDQAFLTAFAGARRVIRVETPRLDDVARLALVDAAARGVELRLLLSPDTDAQTAVRLHDNLVAAGIPDPCRRLRIRWSPSTPTAYTSIDGELVISGTSSAAATHATSYAVDDAGIAAKFDEQVFETDWQASIPAQCPP